MSTPITQNTLLGTKFADSLIGQNGSDAIAGNEGDDFIRGGGGSDLLLGGKGADDIDGGTGTDTLYGGSGNDILSGGAGADWLSGDEGADSLKGGGGADVFFFNGHTAGVDGSDTVVDFNAGLGDTLAFGKFAAGTDIEFVQSGSNTLVYSYSATAPSLAGPSGTLIATVLNSDAAVVELHSSFDFLV